MKDKLDDNAEEIFKAMAEENQSVGKTGYKISFAEKFIVAFQTKW